MALAGIDAAGTAPVVAPRHGFVTFCVGSGVFAAGAAAQRTAIGWLAWDLTQSVAGVGAFVLVDLLATLWVAPLAGAVTDRTQPYRLLLRTGGGSCLLALVLCALTVQEARNLYLIWGIVLLDASLRGLGQPAQMLAPGMLSAPGRLSRAVATSGISMALSLSIGPALAGLCMHYLDSVALVFALNAVSFLGLFVVLRKLRPWLDQRPPARALNFWQDMQEGFGYALRTRPIRQVLLMALLFSLLARPFGELLPAFVGDVFHGGPGLLSALMVAKGLGAVLGAVLMLRAHDTAQLFRSLCVASLGIVLALLVFVAARESTVILAVIALAGLFHVTCNICMQSLCQLHSAPPLRGRVMALYGLVFRVAPTAGAFAIAQWAWLVPLGRLIGSLAVGYALLVLGVWLLEKKKTDLV